MEMNGENYKKCVYLGPDSPLIDFIIKSGFSVIRIKDKRYIPNADWLVSYGYRYRVETSVLDRFKDKAINLHISYLPWNRGADPNYWSWVDGTPKGVTIHYMDKDFDTGDIIAQKLLDMDPSQHSLASSYEVLKKGIEELFIKTWPLIIENKNERKAQPAGGSSHFAKDKPHLNNGWETRVLDLIRRGL